MQKLISIVVVLYFVACNTRQQTNNGITTSVNSDSATATNNHVKDSIAADSIAAKIKMDSLLIGRHDFTIQWLSFDDGNPGIAFINVTDSAWYSIKGQQESKNGYLKINGIIKPVNPKELLFNGVIEYSIYKITEGEVCRKVGQQTFLNTKNRKYWRMQNMDGCGATTNYVDIFF